MAATKKDLYVGKSLGDLNKQAELPADIGKKGPAVLAKVADTVYRNAYESELLGDEEMAYVLYLRYLDLYKAASKTAEFKKQKEFYNNIFGLANVSKALAEAERLSASLQNRYDLRDAQLVAAKLPTVATFLPAAPTLHPADGYNDLPALPRQGGSSAVAVIGSTAAWQPPGGSGGGAAGGAATAGSAAMPGVRSGSGLAACGRVPATAAPAAATPKVMKSNRGNWPTVLITCEQLYTLLYGDGVSEGVLVMDMRSPADYAKSHIRHKACINVPSQIVPSGGTVRLIEPVLPADSLSLWRTRGSCGHIVLLDTNSSGSDCLNTQPQLLSLKNAIFKYDQQVIVQSEPLVLDGGYDRWLCFYPQYTTNASVAAAACSLPAGGGRPVTGFLPKAVTIEYRDFEDTPQQEFSDQETSLERIQQIKTKESQAVGDLLRQKRQLEDKVARLQQLSIARERTDDEWEEDEWARRLEAKRALQVAEERLHAVEHEADAPTDVIPTIAKIVPLEQVDGSSAGVDQPNLDRLVGGSGADGSGADGDAPVARALLLVDRALMPPPAVAAAPLPPLATEQQQPSVRASHSRSIKTLTAEHLRLFEPEYGRLPAGLTGLYNMGNTCYLNSVLQCLSNTAPITAFFTNDDYAQHINEENREGTGGIVASEFALLLKVLWDGNYKCITPRQFKDVVGRLRPRFAGFQQQDCQELLVFLLGALHEDLNTAQAAGVRLPPPSQAETSADNHRSDEEAARAAWDDHKLRNQSIITQLFQGQFRSTVTCSRCGWNTRRFDAFLYLALEIPSNVSRCSLQDCLRLYLREEKIDGFKCEKCKNLVTASKKIDIWYLPPILMVFFKRFKNGFSVDEFSKVSSTIDFPLDALDVGTVAAAASSPASRSKPYSLFAVVNHHEAMHSGHYTACCKNPVSQSWYKFNDETVSPISPSDVKSAAAYVLFYDNIHHMKLIV